jgi:hypothetical protein
MDLNVYKDGGEVPLSEIEVILQICLLCLKRKAGVMQKSIRCIRPINLYRTGYILFTNPSGISLSMKNRSQEASSWRPTKW